MTVPHSSSATTSRSFRPENLPALVRPREKPAILLVDDDQAVCDALERMLSLDGWRVISAQSGEQALLFLQAFTPSLLITDLCMTRINGWDLLFHERLQRPGLPIFVITALPPKLTLDAERFATAFFSKPVDPEALLAAVRRHLGSP
jgi:DNA-binding NtrC family response regulator